MADKLGVFVSSDEHLDHLIGICQTAHQAGKQVEVFLSNEGVRLSQHPDFAQLDGICHVRVCNIGFERRGLEKPVTGVDEKDFGTQMRNAMMIEDSDRYIVL